MLTIIESNTFFHTNFFILKTVTSNLLSIRISETRCCYCYTLIHLDQFPSLFSLYCNVSDAISSALLPIWIFVTKFSYYSLYIDFWDQFLRHEIVLMFYLLYSLGFFSDLLHSATFPNGQTEHNIWSIWIILLYFFTKEILTS